MMSTAQNNSNSLLEWSTPLILITDDDEIHRTLLYETLKQIGYRVIQASNGKECLSAYLRYGPDLVLLDLEMPEVDGLQCLQKLKSLAGDALAPVLIMSALTQPEVMEQTFTAGATDYITKPINWPILKRRMQQALQTRQAIAVLERQLQQTRANSVALETQLQEQTAHHVQFYQMAQVRTQELEQLIQLKDGLLNRVSHELRSPLTNMSLAVEMLLQQFHLILAQKETALFLRVNLEKILTYLEILRRQCRREIQLINNLLDLQLLDTGRHPLSIEVLDLGDWLTTIIQPFWQRTRERQQRLQLLTLPDLPAIQTDASILEQVVSELLTNACKYTPPQGKITITTQAVVRQPSESSADPTYSTIHISVSNTGTEIPAEALPQIFEPFYRVPKSDRWQQGGTGLGLALVQRMVEHLGGTIHVSSTANQTHFTVELPQILNGG